MSAVGLISAARASAIPAAAGRPRPAATQAATTSTASAPSRKPRTPLLSQETGQRPVEGCETERSARRGTEERQQERDAREIAQHRRQLDRGVLGLAVVQVGRARRHRAPRPAPQRHGERRIVHDEVPAAVGHEPERLRATQLRDEVPGGHRVRVAVDARHAVRVRAGGPGLPVLGVPRARRRQERHAHPGTADERGHQGRVAYEARGVRAADGPRRPQRDQCGRGERGPSRGERQRIQHGRRGEQQEGRRRERDREGAGRIAARQEREEDEGNEERRQHARARARSAVGPRSPEAARVRRAVAGRAPPRACPRRGTRDARPPPSSRAHSSAAPSTPTASDAGPSDVASTRIGTW